MSIVSAVITTALRSLTVVLAGSVLTLSACGGGDIRNEQIGALEDQNADLNGGESVNPFGDLTDEQTDCLDDEAPDVDFGKVLTDATAEGVAERVTVTGALITCLPDLRENEAFVQQITNNFNAALGATADVDVEEGGCLLGYVLDNSPDPASSLADGSSEADVVLFQDGFQECFDADTQAAITGVDGGGAQAYGDDPRLDSLHDDCDSGDDRACDILFIDALDGSEYADLAIDCAGRGDGLTSCTPGLEVDETGEVVQDSEAMTSLETDCGAGDMTACDLLYRAATIGSDLEQFGFTCGGKIVAGGLPDCRTRFPE